MNVEFNSFTKGFNADYRGSIRFHAVGFKPFINSLLEWSFNDYALTDKAVRLALSFYSGIAVESIVADSKNGGAVLKEVYLDQLSLITGLSKDNISLQRAVLKVPEGVGCINLFNQVKENTIGIYKPMYRVIAHRPLSYDSLKKYGIGGFRFNKADGEVFVDIEQRAIYWNCMKSLYPYHSPLIDFISNKVDKTFFSKERGGVVITPNDRKEYGDGKEVAFGSLLANGYEFGLGVNGTYSYRIKNFEKDSSFPKPNTIEGLQCPVCKGASIFKVSNSWSCGKSCGFSIPFEMNDVIISAGYAMEFYTLVKEVS